METFLDEARDAPELIHLVRDNRDATLRLGRQITDLVVQGQYKFDPADFPGMSREEVGRQYMHALSEAGATLGSAGRFVQEFSDELHLINDRLDMGAHLGSGGFGLTFSTAEGRPNRDVGFIAVSAGGQKSAVVWLTGGTGDETAPHLARYGSTQFLASWREGADAKLAVVSAAGAVVEGPVTANVGVAERDDFGRWPSGDVGWAEGAGASLRVSRVRSCP